MSRQLVPLAQIHGAQLKWLWQHRIPLGCLTILEGDPGQAKSAITYDLAARVTRGGAMPQCQEVSDPAGVVLLQGEDDLSTTVVHNLLAAGADIKRIQAYVRFGTEPLQLPADLGLVADAAAEVRAKLVVVDPADAYLASTTSRRIRKDLTALAAFAAQTGAAVLLVRHLANGLATPWSSSCTGRRPFRLRHRSLI